MDHRGGWTKGAGYCDIMTQGTVAEGCRPRLQAAVRVTTRLNKGNTRVESGVMAVRGHALRAHKADAHQWPTKDHLSANKEVFLGHAAPGT